MEGPRAPLLGGGGGGGGAGWQGWLERHPSTSATVAAVACAVGYLVTYFIKYPLYVLPLDNKLGGITLKIWVSLANTIGFGLAKIPSYLLVPSLPRRHRLRVLLALIATMLVLMDASFAVLPPVGVPVGVFLGAVCGSSVFGIMMQYLEGRRSTEATMATTNLAIVFGGAASRAIGQAYLSFVPGRDMPVAVAATFFPGCVALIAVLHLLPKPSTADEALRSPRKPMTVRERSAFLRRYAPGVACLYLNNMLLMGFRNFRDYFALEVYASVLKRNPTSRDYLLADWPGGVLSSLAVALLVFCHDNHRAVAACHLIMLLGAALVGLVTFLYQRDWIGAEVFISGIGVGLYTAYGPTGCIVYERLLSASRTPGTVAFLIFFADALGYTSTTALLLFKTLYHHRLDYTDLFVYGSYGVAALSGLVVALSWAYFSVALRTRAGPGALAPLN